MNLKYDKILKGNNFKKKCNYYLDEFGFGQIIENPVVNIPYYFVKTDFIDLFFSKYKPKTDFIILTHNSDYHINYRHLNYLNDPFLKKWYAQNVDLFHEKLSSVPIGIANEKWPHGNMDILKKIIGEENMKDNLVYVNFSVHTNMSERSKCLSHIKNQGLQLSEKKDFENYLRDVSKSYFVISPNGNGVDCHKTWESLYLKSIPIVTRSTNINFYNKLPIMIIDDWETFNMNSLSLDSYKKIWNNFKIDNLNVDFFLK